MCVINFIQVRPVLEELLSENYNKKAQYPVEAASSESSRSGYGGSVQPSSAIKHPKGSGGVSRGDSRDSYSVDDLMEDQYAPATSARASAPGAADRGQPSSNRAGR